MADAVKEVRAVPRLLAVAVDVVAGPAHHPHLHLIGRMGA